LEPVPEPNLEFLLKRTGPRTQIPGFFCVWSWNQHRFIFENLRFFIKVKNRPTLEITRMENHATGKFAWVYELPMGI
jgi:hypothetical protein